MFRSTLNPAIAPSTRHSALGIFAVMVLALPPGREPFFTLGAGGALHLAVANDEAQYGFTATDEGSPLLTISLGATRSAAALTLSMPTGRVPARGRYAIRTWEDRTPGEPQFEALFVAGAPDHPLGAFRGESGWVTITSVESGRISGEFEIKARGFIAADIEDEDKWVTVRGSFHAHGDSAVASIQSVSRI